MALTGRFELTTPEGDKGGESGGVAEGDGRGGVVGDKGGVIGCRGHAFECLICVLSDGRDGSCKMDGGVSALMPCNFGCKAGERGGVSEGVINSVSSYPQF